MKKTVALLCLLTVLLLIFPISIGCVALATPAQFDQTFLGEMSSKLERLESIDEPKIIIIGGSSTAFGIRSDLMEQQLGMPVVNFGLYASLGTKIMLDLSKVNIGQNDIIIIAPEQDKQTLSTYFNPDSAWKALDGSFRYLEYIHSDDMPKMLGNLVSFAAEKYKYLSKGEKPEVKGVYTKEAFNKYGDISYPRPSNTMFGAFDKNTPISFDTDILSEDFLAYLNDYCRYAQGKKARVFFSFSPMNSLALEADTDSEDIYNYFSYLQDKLDFPVISNPETYLMEPNWFYDSNFHMNDSGAVLHTRNLTRDIMLSLGINEPCTIPMPEMPALPTEGETEQQENELFLFNQTEQGVELIGLTEKGAAKEAIEVPAEINGKTVIAIAANTFNSEKTVSITLNKGITYIADGAFEGSTSLKQLVILSSEPAEIRVSEELLRGAPNCVIYVPSGAYEIYSNDYYWAFYCDNSLLEELE